MVEIRSKSIPASPRSKRYPAGSVIAGGGGGNTTITGGGGSSVDIVKQSDSKSFTDSNVLSSLRTMLEIRSRILAEADVTTEPTDDNTLSSLRAVAEIDKAIQKALAYVEKTYLNKTKNDKAVGNYEFTKDITVGQLAKTLNLEVTQLATIAQAVVGMISSPVFVDGFAGEGYKIWKDLASGDWTMTLDRITVRKVMAVYELLIQRVRSVGGSMVMSQADGKIKTVEKVGNNYILTFEIGNTFQPNDLLRHQVFTGDSVKYYWVEVARVSGETVTVPVSEFGDVGPAVGDEVVQIGNTRNAGRQSLIMLSAIEDGKPKIDLFDGVNSKSFEGKLKTRIGWIGDITDTHFPADKQPSGYGVYTNNLFARGVFILSTGEDVLTKFQILEGLFLSEISSIRDEIQKKDNYLFNSAFASNTNGWAATNDVRFLTVDGRTLYFNRNFYSEKRQVADVVRFDAKSVLRIKNSGIRQLNAALARRPEAGEPDAEDPKFFMSFRYRVMRAGVLSVGFSGQGLWQEVRLEATDDFVDVEYSGTWDGTGDFELRFTGDAYFYSLALTDNAFEDYITKFNTEIRQTNERITLLAEKVNDVDGALKSEIEVRADGIQLLNEKTSAIDGRIDQIGIDINGINNNLWLYVKKGSVISEINISQEQIKINSKNISLEGLTTINGKFRVLEDGSVEGTDVKLTGTITATGGAVGGFKISSSQLLSKSGSNEMLLSSDLIRFTDQYNSVYIGADTYPSEGGGVLSTPIRIHSNRPSQSMANGNIGVHISVEGATVYDDVIYTGNHALYIPKGGICGFRLRMRRVSTSQTLSVMDSVILVQSTQRITLTLPANAEDGQRYEIRNTGSGSFRLAAYGAVKIVGGKSGNATTNDSSSAALHTVIFDKVNLIWWLNWSNCD